MEAIRLDNVSLVRRTQEEFSYDLKKTILSFLEGKYHKPSKRCVLNDISLVIESGEKVGIIGANGSGKSTLLKVICSILEPTSGRVWVKGNIAPLIELGAGFDTELSATDNIILYGVMLGFSEQEMRRRIPEVLEFAELEDYASTPVKALSSGMIARLGFAIATDVKPDILILDEVLSVGDESFKNKSKQRIENFWQDHATILLVSHDLNFLQKSCERVIWLEKGRVKSIGNPEDLVQAYLESVNLAEARPSEINPTQIEDTTDFNNYSEEAISQVDNGEKVISQVDNGEEVISQEFSEILSCTGEIILPPSETAGGVFVSRMSLTSHANAKQCINRVPFRSPFYVVIEYTITVPIEKLQIGFYITDYQDRIILEPASHNWLPLTGKICELGNHCIYAKVPAPLLVPGQYHIVGIGVYEPGLGHHYCLTKKLLRFDVELMENEPSEWFGQEIVHPMIEWNLD
jgi:ABC-type polysaccharide/polyol phosphate transport system ATPase subunit